MPYTIWLLQPSSIILDNLAGDEDSLTLSTIHSVLPHLWRAEFLRPGKISSMKWWKNYWGPRYRKIHRISSTWRTQKTIIWLKTWDAFLIQDSGTSSNRRLRKTSSRSHNFFEDSEAFHFLRKKQKLRRRLMKDLVEDQTPLRRLSRSSSRTQKLI